MDETSSSLDEDVSFLPSPTGKEWLLKVTSGTRPIPAKSLYPFLFGLGNGSFRN